MSNDKQTQEDKRKRDREGAEKDSDSHDVSVPFEPHEDDDSELGDTDQHSTA